MATWLTHLRIAAKLLEYSTGLPEIPFLAGNIGPDCSKKSRRTNRLVPSRADTHYITKSGIIDAQAFFDSRITSSPMDINRRAFLLGYYVHLLVDRQWDSFIRQSPAHSLLYQPVPRDQAAIQDIKEEWTAHDLLYLQTQPDAAFFRRFCNIESFPDYLDIYPPAAVFGQIRNISRFYTGKRIAANWDFRYLQPAEMELFIQKSIDLVRFDSNYKLFVENL